MLPQFVVVDIAADQHQLIFAITGPVGVVDGKAFACQMEHMAAFAFVEPEDSLGPEPSWGIWLSRKFWNLRNAKGPSLWNDREVKPSMS